MTNDNTVCYYVGNYLSKLESTAQSNLKKEGFFAMPKTKYTKTRYESIFTYDTKNGQRYYIRIKYQDSAGKWREKTASGLINLTAAKRKKVELQELVNKDQTFTFDADKMTFKQLRENYYKVTSLSWAKNTKLSTLSIYENHLSYFDSMTLNKIGKSNYQIFINQKLHQDDLSISSVKKIHAKMTAILNHAVEEEILVRNKLRKVKFEKLEVAKKEKHLETESLANLDKLAKDSLCPIKYACYVLMRVGLRRGESLGLRKGSVKRLDENTINIVINNAKTAYENQATLKTKNSYRTIQLQGDYAKAILSAVGEADLIHKKHQVNFNDSSYIIINKHNCKTYNYNMPYDILQSLGEQLKIRIFPHMLRHSFATHSRKKGHDLVTVAGWLGHTPKISQEVYDHITKESHLKLAEYVNAK